MSAYAFIPKNLIVEGREELNDFPFNVLFEGKRNINGLSVGVIVLYLPNLSSFSQKGDTKVLEYKNSEDPRFKLVFSYNTKSKKHTCEKYKDNDLVGIADGGDDWDRFFIQVALLRIHEEENCIIRDDYVFKVRQFNQWAASLTLEQVNNLSDEEILSWVIENPNQPNRKGFMFDIKYFKSQKHLSEIATVLMRRLKEIQQYI